MKRLLIAVVLLAASITLCAVCTHTLSRHTDRLISELDRLAVFEDSGTLQKAATDFAKQFQKASDVFSLFLPDERLHDVCESAALLPSLTHDTAAFREEVARCRHLLGELQKGERLSFENIL